MDNPKCPACGVEYREHLGINGTCGQLQIAIRGLKLIARSGDRSVENCWLSDAVRDILSDIENYGE